MTVHEDLIATSSSRLRDEIVTGNKIHLKDHQFHAVKRYVHYLYTTAVVDPYPVEWHNLVIDYYCGCWLRDVRYTNSIMDELIDNGLRQPDKLLDLVAWLGTGNNDTIKDHPSSCFWRWLTDAVGSTMSSEQLRPLSLEDEWPVKFMRALLLKVLARMEDPEHHKPLTLADREIYHVNERHFEDAVVP